MNCEQDFLATKLRRRGLVILSCLLLNTTFNYNKVNNIIYYKRKSLVTLIFLLCSARSVVISAEKVATIDEGTEALVMNLRNLGGDFKKSIDLKDQQLTNNLVSVIKGVWQRIIDKLKPDLYEDLIFYTAQLLFLDCT